MSDEEIKNKIIDMIIELTDYNDLRKNIKIDLLEEDILDSLAFIELISGLEDEFNIEIQPTQVESDSWRTVDNLVELVKELQK